MKKALLLFPFLLLILLQVHSQEGILDSSFGLNGSVRTDTIYNATAFQSDGKLVGVNKITGGFILHRYNTDGTRDITFGNSGAITTLIPYLTVPTTVLVATQPVQDDIVVQIEGPSSFQNEYGFPVKLIALISFNKNGILNNAFGSGGILSDHNIIDNKFRYFVPFIRHLTVQRDGKILTASATVFNDRYGNGVLTRYYGDGTKDWSTTITINEYTTITALSVGEDGKIAVGIHTSNSRLPFNETTYLLAFSPGWDSSFSSTTWVRDTYSSIAIQPDGKLLAALGQKLNRFNTDGTFDLTFGILGTVDVGFTIKDIVLEQDNRIIVGGGLNSNFVLARFNENGTKNFTFGIEGKTATDFSGNESINKLKVSGNHLYAHGSEIIARYKLSSNCVPPTFVNNALIVLDATCGNQDGNISIIPTSGTKPFEYSIDGGKTYVSGPDKGSGFLNLAAGKYMLRLRDVNGCESEVAERIVGNNCLPTITNFTPSSGYAGTLVTITGNNFNAIPANNTVYFGAVKAAVTAATRSELTVIVPAGATAQPITVTTNGLTAYSHKPFALTFPNNASDFSTTSFAAKVNFPTITKPSDVAVGDIDNDGKPDMVVANTSSPFTVSVFKNISGSGGIVNFERTDITIDSLGFLYGSSVAIGDVDGDGKLDIAVAVATSSQNIDTDKVYILRNVSSGGAIAFAPKKMYEVGSVHGPISIRDLDGDGKNELVLPHFIQIYNTSPLVSILRNLSNTGTVSFAEKAGYGTGDLSTGNFITDLDGDGKADVVVKRALGTGIFHTTVLKNKSIKGTVAFPLPQFDLPGVNVTSVGDLDDDGKPELVISTSEILQNISSGSSIAFNKISLPAGTGGSSAIADLDGDGKPDLLNTTADTLTVSKNLTSSGTISFAPRVVCGEGNGGYPFTNGNLIVVVDFDGDSKPDIAVFNASLNNVSVLRNQIGDCTPPTFVNNNLIVLDASCANNDGNVSIIPTSGTPPFMYSKDGGVTYVAGPNSGSGFQNLAAGFYKLRLKDAKGCESEIVEKEVKLNCSSPCTPPTFVNNALIVLEPSCANNDGNISIIPTSGTAPFMYSKDGGVTYAAGPNTGSGFTSLSAGTYKLRLKDARGCESAIVEKTLRINADKPCNGSEMVMTSAIAEKALAQVKELVSIYPNPSTGQFKLQLQNFNSPKVEVSVFDAKGILIQKRWLNLTQTTIVDFDLKGEAPGMYLIKVTTSKGTQMQKVLIQ